MHYLSAAAATFWPKEVCVCIFYCISTHSGFSFFVIAPLHALSYNSNSNLRKVVRKMLMFFHETCIEAIHHVRLFR